MAWPTYFIAEIGSNFDGDLGRAKALADLAKESGADAAKYQSFLPEKIIHPAGFRDPEGFQSKWKKSVWEVYSDAALPRDWHVELRDHCTSIGLDFFSSPYDAGALALLDELGVVAHKIGSGEINNPSFLRLVAASGRPVILATGASTLVEVAEAVEILRSEGTQEVALLQCVTNYPSTFESANVRAMVTLAETFDVVVGYSDHTPGHLVPAAAVALGGRIIEKHFTDDRTREGPDHSFAMTGSDFKEMVDHVRLLEHALGDGVKQVESEEEGPRVFQRRGLWITNDCPPGHVLRADDIDVLRPAHGLPPALRASMVGLTLPAGAPAGTPLTWDVLRGSE